MAENCPATEELAAALRGRLPAAEEAELAVHLADCADCRRRLEELAGGSGWLETRAKGHAKSSEPVSEVLKTVMQALESSPHPSEAEPPSPVQVDFLRPADKAGLLGYFGPYEVLEQVAAGGMGIVLKARDPGLDRVVALKVLPPVLAANSLARARFVREARAAAAVVHEHVVPIHAVDEFAGLPYLVMQFISGRPLSERLRATGPLRVEEILRIGAQAADGLAAAHAQGLIHRDVKPGNILLENSVERVKLTDFGLARAADDASLTRDGYVAGTPEYMSPEQARGEPVEPRSDLFSLGCVLYEMATGVSPFHAEKPLVAMRRVCDEEPAPAHRINARVPEWLSEMIQCLMAKDVGSRPATAAEVSAELRGWLAELAEGRTPAFSKARQPNWNKRGLSNVVLVFTVMAVLAAGIFFFTRTTPPKQEAKTPTESLVQPELFFLVDEQGGRGRGFAKLGDAIEAASSPAEIECRFNGPQPLPTLSVGSKPLILKAAKGFDPALVPENPGAPLFFARGPVILEGLTFSVGPAPRDSLIRTDRSRRMYISVEDSPFFAAHCRFENESNAAENPPMEFLRLPNVSPATIFNCQFESREGFAIGWSAQPNATLSEVTNRITVSGCVVNGSLLSRGGRAQVVSEISLRDNTFCGGTLLMIVGGTPKVPIQIAAARNVFVVDRLILPFRAESAPLEKLVRWQGESNVYKVDLYARTTPSVSSHAEWIASPATELSGTVSVDLEIARRVNSLADRTQGSKAAAFILTPEERRSLAKAGWAASEPPGANPERTGPGRPYDLWRASAGYQDWLKLIRQHATIANR